MILTERDVEVHYDWDENNGIEEGAKEKKENPKEEKPKEEVKEVKKESSKPKERKITKKEKKKTKKEKKNKNKIFFILTSIIILIAIVLIVVNIGKGPSEEVKTTNIAALVDGETITLDDLNTQYNKISPQEKDVISKEFLLSVLIDNKLLLQKADEKGVFITDEEIESEISRIKAQFPSEESFNQFLESQAMTLQTLKEITIEQLKIKKVLSQEAFAKITVTDSEAEAYYKENTDQFIGKEGEIRAAHILLNTAEDAEEVLKKIEAGEDFSILAKENSIGPSAPNGGELGFFGKLVMVKEFEDAAFALAEGEVSGVVQTQFGYHIIKRNADTIPLEDVKSQIKQSLMFSKQRAVYQTYMGQLRAQADIKVYYGVSEVPEELEIPVKETFEQTTDELCEEDGKPIIRLFSTTNCPNCNWIKETFDSAVKEYADNDLIVAKHWQLDSGDNTLTTDVETKIPKEEVELFKKYNPGSTVPTFVFGCKYYRIGNGYDDLELEKKEIKNKIDNLLS